MDAQLGDMHQAAMEALQEARADARAKEEAAWLSYSISAAVAADKREKARVIAKTITQEVIRYVQTPAAADFGVDADGVRIIDAAASRRVPANTRDTAPSDDDTAGATAGEIVASVAGNYDTCNDTREQLIELQAWVRGLDEIR